MSGPQRRQQMAQQPQQQAQYPPPYNGAVPHYAYQGQSQGANGYATYGNSHGYVAGAPQQQYPYAGGQSQYAHAGTYVQGSPGGAHLSAYPAQPGMLRPGPSQMQQSSFVPTLVPGNASYRPPYQQPIYGLPGSGAPGPSAASSPGSMTPLARPVQQLSQSTGHSPRPSAGRTRLQAFVFPQQSGADGSLAQEMPGNGIGASATPGDESGIVTSAQHGPSAATTAALPMKPAFAVNPATGPVLAQEASMYGPAGMQRMGSYPGRRPESSRGFYSNGRLIPSSSQDLAMGSSSLNSEISLRYPALPDLPAMPDPPTDSQEADEGKDDGRLEEYRQYSTALKAVVDAYRHREQHLRLRTEAVGFDPRRAWSAWERGKGESDLSTQANATDEEAGTTEKESAAATQISEGPNSILGVRLLQRVAKLTEENDELGRQLEELLKLSDGAEPSAAQPDQTSDLLHELQDAHALISSLDTALTKAEARAAASERALQVACVNNSTSIVESASKEGDLARVPIQGTALKDLARAPATQRMASLAGVDNETDGIPASQAQAHTPAKTGSDRGKGGRRGHGQGQGRHGDGRNRGDRGGRGGQSLRGGGQPAGGGAT